GSFTKDTDFEDEIVINDISNNLGELPFLQKKITKPRVSPKQIISQQGLPGLINPQDELGKRSGLENKPVNKQNANLSDSVDAKILALMKQVEKLTNERNELRKDVDIKSGEIAIVRSKYEKTALEFERELLAARKLNDEKLEQQQRILEAARISEQNAITERDFIKRDLVEESNRVRQLSRVKETENKQVISITASNEKHRTHGDGFDGDQPQPTSQSKLSPFELASRITDSPNRSIKRKRKTVQIQTENSSTMGHREPINTSFSENSHIAHETDERQLRSLKGDEWFDFMGSMLDHRVDEKHLRTIQELGKYSLPSTPKQTFQTSLLAKIPELKVTECMKDFPTFFCETLISMWIRCVDEEYLKPIYLFVDMLTVALEMKTSSLAPHIINSLVPITQRTSDFIAIPRFQSQPTDKYDQYIDLSACMSLLYIASLGCISKSEDITRFWKLMRWDFVLLMLSTNQSLTDYDLILRLISTSIMTDSLGAIPGGEKQQLQAGWIIDRLTYPLSEHPCMPMSTKRFDTAKINQVRIKILRIMISMVSRSLYASKTLATHPHAIGRVICLISDELDELYNYQSRSGESTQIINMATRLLYYLVTRHQSLIDMQQILANIHGGYHKYLLSLSRLNFSEEDLVLESGIDTDIASYALELLELVVTPAEGDAIQSAFTS
ncbi:DNA repair protein Rad26, partial [Blumeria hordei DH14]